jgi:hypothetical protein
VDWKSAVPNAGADARAPQAGSLRSILLIGELAEQEFVLLLS